MVLRSCGKSISTELWILVASWNVIFRKSVASTMRTCLLTTCALAPAPVFSEVLGLRPRLGLGLDTRVGASAPAVMPSQVCTQPSEP